MERRLAADLSGVRVHHDAGSAQLNRELGSEAFTSGHDIFFREGRYQPASSSGSRLLAHELAHVVQQNPARARSAGPQPVRRSSPWGMVSPAWEIKNPGRKHPKGATKTDAEHLLEAFQKICPKATRSGDEIKVPKTATAKGHTQGCACLTQIERDLPKLKTSRPVGTVEAEPFGWSRTGTSLDPVEVFVRHPVDPFGWGYWTNVTKASPYERRKGKPFFLTLAHEVCGHVWTFVRTGGKHAGGRTDNPRAHDPAIELENLIAAEHGVATEEQRGFEFEKGSRPGTRYAGESFLSGRVTGFKHASDDLAGTTADELVDSASKTKGVEVFIDLRGAAYGNEGGRLRADARADKVVAKMRAAGITETFDPRRGPKGSKRFRVLPGHVPPGASTPVTSDAGRRVDVILYHDPRSAERVLPTDIFFDFDKPTSRTVSDKKLDEVTEHVMSDPSRRVELVGHTDVAGPKSYNEELGLNRAEHVASELMKRGVSASQIRAVRSRGEEDARAKSKATRWQDRRVEIKP